MPLTKVTYSMIDGAPVNVLDFGADPTGSLDSHAAFVAALAASDYVFVPTGTYLVTDTISITGNKTIVGPQGGAVATQYAQIVHTAATGNLFESTDAAFGGIYIGHLKITGGAGDYAIYSTKPQSTFESIYMDTYDGSGIALENGGSAATGSWGSLIRNCRWVGPATATAYRGYQININGGHVTLEGCEAVRGSIGINVDAGEAINIYRCSTNLQCNTTTYPYSSLSRDNQCGIRLSGALTKKAINISECYIEGFTYGIYVEKANGLNIQDNYIADLGINSDFVGTPGSDVYLKDNPVPDGNINSVTISTNVIQGVGNGASTVYIGNNATNVILSDNSIYATGGPPASTAVTKGTGTVSYVGANTLTVNPSIGIAYADPNGLLSQMVQTSGTWTAGIVGSSTSGTYQIASQTSTYTIIGRTITLNAYITLAGVVTGGGAGDLSISGLPQSGKTGKISVGSVMFSGVNYTTAGASLVAEMNGTSHSETIKFVETSDNAAFAYVPIGSVTANNVIAFTITYEY